MNSGLIDVDALVEGASELAPLPASTVRLASLIAEEDADLEEIAQTIRLDEALTGRLLGAANSSRSGSLVTITTVEEAVLRRGPGTVLALALGAGLGQSMRAALPEYGLSEGGLWRHSVAAALAVERARRYCQRPGAPEAFAAALLHDVGKLVMARHLSPAAIEEVRAAAHQRRLSMDEAEREVLGIGHAQVGARVARHWGLPESIAQSIEYHHVPFDAPDDKSRRLCALILLADAVAAEVEAPCSEHVAGFSPAIAGRLGITSDGFADLCEDVRAQLADVLEAYGAG